MSRSRDAYTLDLAGTVDRLFGDGRTDPSTTEIAHEHFGREVLGGEIIDGVQKRLRTISKILEESYQHQVCTVSERYYLKTAKRPSYRDDPPKTDAEARLCLPIGQGVRAVGIRLSTGNNDRIYQAAISQGFASGAGKVKLGFDRTITGMEAGRIPEDRAVTLVREADRRSMPQQAAALKQLKDRALPDK